MDYLTAKWLHILSSTVLFGTGLGSAYYMFFASLSRDPAVAASVGRLLVRADWVFTGSTLIVQPLSGIYLAHLVGLPLMTAWLAWSFALYLLAGVCWLPVVWLQIRMRDLAGAAAVAGEPLPPLYFRYLTLWTLLGIPAFFALVGAFYLMVAKPV